MSQIGAIIDLKNLGLLKVWMLHTTISNFLLKRMIITFYHSIGNENCFSFIKFNAIKIVYEIIKILNVGHMT